MVPVFSTRKENKQSTNMAMEQPKQIHGNSKTVTAQMCTTKTQDGKHYSLFLSFFNLIVTINSNYD